MGRAEGEEFLSRNLVEDDRALELLRFSKRRYRTRDALFQTSNAVLQTLYPVCLFT